MRTTIPRTRLWEVKLRGIADSLGAQERICAEYLLNHADTLKDEKIATIAKKCNTSQSTIVRMCQKMGYSGLKELKIAFASENGSYELIKERKDKTETLKERIANAYVRAIQDTMDLVDDKAIKKATEHLCKASFISIYAIGGSVPVARNFRHQLMKLGIHSNVYTEMIPSLIEAEKYGKNDIAIAITHSGSTPAVVQALKSAHSKGATTICITNYSESDITKYSDICLYTTSETLNPTGDHSPARMAETAIVNLLYFSVATEYEKKHMI